jgi:predicted nucleotidyltransferase
MTFVREISMQHPSLFLILAQLRKYVEQCYGNQLKHLTLFGSQACNEAICSSDIDVMLVLERVENTSLEYDRISKFVAEICLEHDVLVSCVLIHDNVFQTRATSLSINVRREGIAA